MEAYVGCFVLQNCNASLAASHFSKVEQTYLLHVLAPSGVEGDLFHQVMFVFFPLTGLPGMLFSAGRAD